MMGKLTTGSELVAALRAAGLADDNTRRVVIDIRYDQPPIVYTEKFGDPGPLVDVVMAAGVEIKQAAEKDALPFGPPHYWDDPNTIVVPREQNDGALPLSIKTVCSCHWVETTSFPDQGKSVRTYTRAQRGADCTKHAAAPPLNSPAPFNPEFYCGHMSRPYGDFAYLQCAREPGHDGLHGGYLRTEVLAWGNDGRISSGHLRLDKLDEGRHARELGIVRRLGEKPNTIDAAHSKYARRQALDMTCVICGADIGEECVPIDSAMMFDPGLHHLRKNRYDALMEKGGRVERKDG